MVRWKQHLQLTNDVKECELSFCGGSIDLAHIPASILLPDIRYVQVPRPVVFVWHADPRISRYDLTVHSQDRRLLVVHPRHLHIGQIPHMKI